jgi:hypothetical protein
VKRMPGSPVPNVTWKRRAIASLEGWANLSVSGEDGRGRQVFNEAAKERFVGHWLEPWETQWAFMNAFATRDRGSTERTVYALARRGR